MDKRNLKRMAELGIVMTAVAALVVGCGGSSSSSSSGSATVALSGVVADGYLSGAKVCLDKNDNGVCDSGEPSATTNASGVYSISGLTSADSTGYPVIAEIPASAVDSDFPASTVGQAYTLAAPKGNKNVTPLSALVYQEMQRDTTLSAASAVANVQTATGIGTAVDPLRDYIADGNTNVHKAAQVLAKSIRTNMANAAGLSGKQLHALLSEAALGELQNQGVLGASGVAAANPASAVVGAFNAAHLAAVAAATQNVTVNFDVVHGATAGIRCGSTLTLANTLWNHTLSGASGVVAAAAASAVAAPSSVGAQATPGAVVDLRFYISDVKLIDGSGNRVPVILTKSAYQDKGVALLDFGNGASAAACSTTYNTSIVGKVKPGTYTGIEMTLGVPYKAADGVSRLNHSNPADVIGSAKPLQNAAMNWAWQSGRKFTKIEFRPTTPATNTAGAPVPKFNVHLGSTGCTGNPLQGLDTTCTNPNRVTLTFTTFNAATNTIALDLAALFKEADMTYEGGGAPGCMSGATDPECAPIFKALGVSLTNGQTVTAGTVVPQSSAVFGESVQSIFSVK